MSPEGAPPSSSSPANRGAPPPGWLAPLVFGVVTLAWLPSLGGGWVWDDHVLFEGVTAWNDPFRLLGQDLFGAVGGESSHIYRPLQILSHLLGYSPWGGPFGERIINLGLHLLTVAGVAAVSLRCGAARTSALLGAAAFGLHPGVSEAVAWVSARPDLLGGVLVMGAFAGMLRGRFLGPGLLLFAAPFAKESLLLTPLALLVMALGMRRLPWKALVLSVAGVGAYLLARHAAQVPFPVGAARSATLETTGGVMLRGLELLVIPGSADALPLLTLHPLLGGGALLVGCSLLVLSWGRPAVAILTASLLLLAPQVAAASQIQLVGDRYFYGVFAGLGVVLAWGHSALSSRSPLAVALWILPLALLPGALLRAQDWRSDKALFSASLHRNPQNPHAAFHVAYDLHLREKNCLAALPLYRLAVEVEPRAGNNLQACLLDLGRDAEAAAMGEDQARRDSKRPTPASNTARAFLNLGNLTEAEKWSREALRRDPDRPGVHLLLARILASQGHHPEAKQSVDRALSLAPGNPEALSLLRELESHSPLRSPSSPAETPSP